MAKKEVSSPQQVTKAAHAAPRRRSRLKAADYREAILILLGKNFSHEEIARFLRNEGVEINQTAISRYLRTHPPTETERRNVVSMPPEQDSAITSDAERRQKPEQLVARVRKERPTEPEDDTDYSFLNVQGRPFRIRPKE
jgi:hypothetical protein